MSSTKTDRSLRPTRRQFVTATAALATATAAARFGISRLAHAQAMGAVNRSRRFIFCYFPGGWDQLLFLDPRDPAVFTEEARARYLTDVRYEQLDNQQGFAPDVVRPLAGNPNFSFGPAVVKPNTASEMARPNFANPAIASKCAIVRGMDMGTVAHEIGYRYFLTGSFPAGNAARGSSVMTQLASGLGSNLPLPTLSLRVEAYNERFEGRYSPLRVNSVDDLLLVMQRDPAQLESNGVEQALMEYANDERSCAVNVYDRRGMLTGMRQAGTTAEEILRGGLASRFASAMLGAPGNPYGLTPTSGDSPALRAAVAAQAIKENVAQCVSVLIGNGTDTHFSNNLDHATRLYPGIMALAALIQDLSNADVPAGSGLTGKWIDHTTIVAFSEFARTPLMNQFTGRDHHIASSCLLAGAGINGGTVIGASGEVGMSTGLWDFQNNRPSETGQPILPEHIAATLINSTGLDHTDHRFDAAVARVPSIDALIRRG